MDQTPLGHLDTAPIPRDAGRVRGVGTARVIPPSRSGILRTGGTGHWSC